jgi:hypothetical protein
MRHPTEGVLRRLLDEPAGVTLSDRSHVADCAECLHSLAGVRQDTELVGAALATEAWADADVAAAWQRLSVATAAAAGHRAVTPLRSARPSRPASTGRGGPRRSRGPDRRGTAAGQRLAADLPRRAGGGGEPHDQGPRRTARPERVRELALPDEPQVRSLSSAADAAELTGLQIPRVSELPSGVSGEPIHQVVGEVSATFTFSAERQPGPLPSRGGAATAARRPGRSAVGWTPGRARRRSGRPRPGRPPWSWPAPQLPRRSRPACRSSRCATTCSRCLDCPTTWRRSCARTPRTAPSCRCPCRPTR